MTRIKQLRIRRGMRQRDLANALGVTDRTISNWECGRNVPGLYNLSKMAMLFECKVQDLINLVDNDVGQYTAKGDDNW